MKTVFFILSFVFFYTTALAQDRLIFNADKFPQTIDAQIAFLKQHIPSIQSDIVSFKLAFYRESKASKHYTYNVFYNNIPVFNNHIKVNTDKKNNIIAIANGTSNFNKYNPTLFALEIQDWEKQKKQINVWPANQEVKNEYLAIYQTENKAEVASIQNAYGIGYDITKVISLNGEVLASFNHARNFRKDTFINANIFSPDPLTFLNQLYGGIYVDSNDQNLNWMNGAYIPVTFPAIYDTILKKFLIENDYVKMVNYQSPNYTPSDSVINDFYYNRSQPGFEECMAAYHITTYHNYLTSIGYDTLMDLRLDIDAHAQFGADNSTFFRNGGAPYITFGDGGVDDAEDADVIIHEYSHGLSWSANNNNITTKERNALDEGLSDYFATSYSRSISSFGWKRMFSWDGHNEHWSGRTAESVNNYTASSLLNIYGLGEIWNTAMQGIYTDLGRTTTDELMCETLFYLTDSTNLPSAAFYMLQADSVLNNGANVPIICSHFRGKNLLSWTCTPFPNSTSDITKIQSPFILKNTHAFNQGTGNALISFPNKAETSIKVYDISGRLILQDKVNSFDYKLSPEQFKTGMYILNIQNNQYFQSFKLSRQ